MCASSIAFAKARSRGLSRSVRHTRPKADSGNSVDRYECDVRALAVCSGCSAEDEADLTECDLRQAFLNGARPTLRGNRGSARRRARGIHTLPIVGGGAGDGYETDLRQLLGVDHAQFAERVDGLRWRGSGAVEKRRARLSVPAHLRGEGPLPHRFARRVHH